MADESAAPNGRQDKEGWVWCCVRTLRYDNASAPWAVGSIEPVDSSGVVKILSPKVPSYRAVLTGSRDVSTGKGNEFVSPERFSIWQPADEMFGATGGDHELDYGPAFYTKTHALNWLSSPAGARWTVDAENYFVLGIFTGNADDVAVPDPGDSKIKEDSGSWHRFDPKGWRNALRQGAVATLPGWVHGCKPANPPTGSKVDDEMQIIRCLSALRSEARVQRICREAAGHRHCAAPVFEAARIELERPFDLERYRIRDRVTLEFLGIVLHFKAVFNVKRPWQYPDHPATMFPAGTRMHPDTPSYPAAHAALAYGWAHLLATRRPQFGPAMLAAAEAITLNREVAGLHFRSDSQAGKALGKALASAYLTGVAGARKVLDHLCG